MSGTKPIKRGSFGSHLDEVVRHFPYDHAAGTAEKPKVSERELREKRDIHALLFEQAWQLDGETDVREG